jgi:DNA-binding beta-propeller fold protein YncE
MLKKLTHMFMGLCALAVLCAGCASKWSLTVESPGEPVQWRDGENVARATYLGSIREFKETGVTISGVLRSVVFGSRKSDNTIKRPVAVAIGRDDRVAIADLGCACVHLYVPSEQKYLKIYGARKEELLTPVSVAFDDESRLYVSDSTAHTIYVFDREGAPLSSIRTAGKDALQRPTGLTYASGEKILYAVDTLAKKVYAFNASGALLFSFGGPGDQEGLFNFPTHIVTSPDGRVYVTDAMNFRVQRFDAAGKFLSSFGHHGNGSGDLALPKGIAVDQAGVIYVVDNLFGNIQLFDLTGSFLFTIGRGGTGDGEFSLPSGLFLAGGSQLYVCDTYNQRVQIFKLNGGEAK